MSPLLTSDRWPSFFHTAFQVYTCKKNNENFLTHLISKISGHQIYIGKEPINIKHVNMQIIKKKVKY